MTFSDFTTGRRSRLSAAARWLAAALFALALHVGVVAFLLSTPRPDPASYTGDAIDVELLPEIAEPNDKPDDVAGQKVAESAATSDKVEADDPTPPAPDSAPPTEKKPDPEKTSQDTVAPTPPSAEAELEVERKTEEKPLEPPVEKTEDAEKDEAERRTEASRASSGAAAQLAGGRRPSAAATATWAGEIGRRLARLRRYPRQARAEGWQGTASVRVTIDGDGHVKARELVKSSGRPILDDEALALVQRSDPFPKPPVGMPTPVALTVPVKFAIR